MPQLATVTVVVLLLLALPLVLHAEEDERPWSQQPFLGLSVRDTPDGLVASWVHPGPLGGRGFESKIGIRRGDNVVSVDGETVDAAGFKAHMKEKAVGDEVLLVMRRSPEANPDASVPKGGGGGETYEVKVKLAAREAWGGMVGRGLGGRTIAEPKGGAFEALILEAAAKVGVRQGLEGVGGGLDSLLANLREVQEKALDPNSLPAVVNCFRRPLSLDAVEADLAGPILAAADGDLAKVEAAIRHVLDLPDPDGTIRDVMEKPAAELTPVQARSMVRFAGQHLRGYQYGRGERQKVERLLRTLREGVYIYDDHADEHVQTINTTAGEAVDVLLALPLAMLRLAPKDWEAAGAEHAGGEPLAEVPEEVRAAVEGEVLWHGQDPLGGIAVVGGPGPNRYDMSRVTAVYDVGGDDRYEYRATSAQGAIAQRIVIDLAGNDVHESASAFEGPATAVYGFSLLDDRAGDDVYRSEHPFAVAAGLMGIGILVDRGGNDVYEARGAESGWGIGVGFWGAGVVIDQGGHDVYHGERYVQGVGGPRGFGLVLDVKGKDLYRANGPSFGSVYDTPAVYVGMSQGVGFGVRGYAAGGVGAIYDLAGNDRYEGGEFSQAGGYYFGLGVLHDLKGHDIYYGNRYGQAFSAHQAIGILVDDEGDDTYWSMTAASQSGIWDQSMGLLLDRKGNDAYRCDGLGQGGASMQAIALLIDLDGDDRYSGSGGSVQGQGGGNSYHYDQDKVFSFSALFDRGGGRDVYSSGRKNGETVATGTFREKKPGNSPLYGVFSDE